MASEWIGPIVAGVTSITAVGATYYTARTSVRAQAAQTKAANEHDFRRSAFEYRREAYAACLSAMRDWQSALWIMEHAETAADQYLGIGNPAHDAVRKSLTVVELVGTSVVYAAARQVRRYMDGYGKGEEQTDEGLLEALIGAMRDDVDAGLPTSDAATA